MQHSSATVRTAKYLLAHLDMTTMAVTITDEDAATNVGVSKRAYRDALRHLDRIGAISYEQLPPGPTRKTASAHKRSIIVGPHSPYWAWLAAAEDIAAMAW